MITMARSFTVDQSSDLVEGEPSLRVMHALSHPSYISDHVEGKTDAEGNSNVEGKSDVEGNSDVEGKWCCR